MTHSQLRDDYRDNRVYVGPNVITSLSALRLTHDVTG